MELALTHRKGHSMPPRSETVRLSPGNWIAMTGLVLTIVCALIGGVWQMTDMIHGLRYAVQEAHVEIKLLRQSLDGINERVKRLERP